MRNAAGRWLKKFFFLTVPALLVMLVILELVFRFAIPASNPPHAYYDPDEQIFRYDLNASPSGRYTFGYLAQGQGRWRINNMGWNSEIDYFTGARNKPLVAIIGDSMVAALQVDVQESMASRLRQQVGDEFDVYSFGTPGAPFIQYLHMARYVNKTFDPDILVFTVHNNDFEQTLCDRWSPVGMVCLEDGGSQIREAEISPYYPSRLRRWARKSSIVRYLSLNLLLVQHIPGGGGFDPVKDFAAQGLGPSVALKNRIENATDYILNKVADENPGRTVIFLLDAPRRYIYTGILDAPVEYDLWTHGLLQGLSEKYGFRFVDLTEPFVEAYADSPVKFDSKYDRIHWNERGNAVAAEALLPVLKEVIGTGQQPSS